MSAERPNSAASTADFEFAALQEANNYRAALVRDFAPYLRGRVIEIGAGIGQITEGLTRLSGVTELLCVEPDPGFCGEFRRRHPGQQLVEGTIGAVGDGAPWDAILSINVLEHIQEDQLELESYHRLLRERRGHLCLFVPARPEIYAPLDRDFGHHRRYTRGLLADRLRAAGFAPVRLRYFNVVGYFAWWFSFCFLKKRGFDRGAVRLFDRWIFPPVHWTETRLCPPPIGQSLMVVARAGAGPGPG